MAVNQAQAVGYSSRHGGYQCEQNELAVLVSIDPELIDLKKQIRIIIDHRRYLRLLSTQVCEYYEDVGDELWKEDLESNTRFIQTKLDTLIRQHRSRRNLITFMNLSNDIRQRLFIIIEDHLKNRRMQRGEPQIVIDEQVSRSFNELSSYEGFTLKYSRCGALVCSLKIKLESINFTSGCTHCDCRDCPDVLMGM